MDNFGAKADEICNSAIEDFSSAAPVPDEVAIDPANGENALEAIYDKKVEDLERLVDAPLHVLYLKQLTLSRDRALRLFRSTLASTTASNLKEDPTNPANTGVMTEYEAMMTADERFRQDAEELTRSGNPEWSYARDAQILKQSLLEIANRAKKVQETKLLAAKQSQQAMGFLQMQQQQLQAIQQQMQVTITVLTFLDCDSLSSFFLSLRVETLHGI